MRGSNTGIRNNKHHKKGCYGPAESDWQTAWWLACKTQRSGLFTAFPVYMWRDLFWAAFAGRAWGLFINGWLTEGAGRMWGEERLAGIIWDPEAGVCGFQTPERTERSFGKTLGKVTSHWVLWEWLLTTHIFFFLNEGFFSIQCIMIIIKDYLSYFFEVNLIFPLNYLFPNVQNCWKKQLTEFFQLKPFRLSLFPLLIKW